MEKRISIWFLLSAAVLLLLPWLLISLIPADAGMMVSMLLLFILYPLYFIATGIFAAQDLKKRLVLPIVSAGLFSCGAWLFFQMYDSALFVYAGIYLVLAGGAMLISAQINRAAAAKKNISLEGK